MLALFLLVGCGPAVPPGPPVLEPDSDADADADADSDADTDSDTDSDADADTDSDADAPPVLTRVPAPGTSWHWQLQGALPAQLDVDVVDIDLFDTPSSTIDAFRADGVGVICYFSAGSREDWRSDADAFPLAVRGEPLDGWPGEVWLDVRAQSVRTVMLERLDLAASKHCDGVEPDNVDGFANGSGFPLTEADGRDYLTYLASEAHARGLHIGLKNALEVVDLEPHFDWAINEECLDWSECHVLQPFSNAGKAVLHVEYVDQRSQGPARLDTVCAHPTRAGFSTLVKTWDLDEWGLACP